MWSVVGRRWKSRYPGFSTEGIDGFRHLLEDLQQYGSDFLVGSDADFARHVARVETLKKCTAKLP